MSIPKPPQPAKLVVGLFTSQKELINPVAEALSREFGPLQMVSRWFLFDQTSYYHKEMGAPLFRRMFTFKTLIEQKALADIKCRTNAIEQNHMNGNNRTINLDPGYLLYERFVLATGKNFSHRIYLDKGIYADITLIYQDGDYQRLPWTYPDYADDRLRQHLISIRSAYGFDMQRKPNAQEHDRLRQQ